MLRSLKSDGGMHIKELKGCDCANLTYLRGIFLTSVELVGIQCLARGVLQQGGSDRDGGLDHGLF